MAGKTPPPPETLRRLLPEALWPCCETVPLAAGEVLFRSGRRPTFLHHVDDGEVALQRAGRDGQLMVLQRVRQGFVAEASLEAERYHCDAVALVSSRVTRLPRTALHEALRGDGAFAMRWIAMLNHEVRRLRQHCERLGLNTVQARLLHLIETEGRASVLPVTAGLKSLAREIGVSHEALYRCIADLERRGTLARRAGPPPVLQLTLAAAARRAAAG